MKLLFDTNVILDVLLDRKPHVNYALLLLVEVEKQQINGFACATTITTISYLLQKSLGAIRAREKIKALLQLFDIVPVTRLVLESALDSKFSDYEDAVLHMSALHHGVEGIVTRDKKGFKNATLPIYSPKELVKAFS